MKKSVLIIMFVSVSSLLMAQAAGETIKRSSPQKQSNIKQSSQKTIPKVKEYNQSTVAKPSLRTPNLARGHSQSYIETSMPIISPNVKKQVLKKIVSNMVLVKGGTFLMGKTQEQDSLSFEENRLPVHEVTLNSFYIAKYEITQEEWQIIMGKNPSENKGDLHPVECVSWEDCMSFIEELNRFTGRKFRLPTEAEWEYAARGGINSKHTKYAGGNICEAVAWNRFNCTDDKTSIVGMKLSNELGLCDMSGNVWEWCQDWYGEYPEKPQKNPCGPEKGKEKVCRGGSWLHGKFQCLVSYRAKYRPDCRLPHIGLRLAESVSGGNMK